MLLPNFQCFIERSSFTSTNVKKNSHVQDMNKIEILQEPIWNNKQFLFKGQPIYFKKWVNNIRYVKDLTNENGFKTIEDVNREICTYTMYFVNTK